MGWALKEDWSRKLSKPMSRFRTLRDIRDFILHEFPDGPPRTWEHVAHEAIAAATSGQTADIEAALALVLMIDPRERR
jgi:hypothetical protein